MNTFQVWSRTFLRKINYIPVKIWLFLTIKTVNKDKKSKIKFFRQSFFWYFANFLCLSKYSFHHKWNETWLLVKKLVYMSFFTSCPSTSDWISEEITEDQENLNTWLNYCVMFSALSQIRIFSPLQPVTGYLRLTLVFVWSGALW